ncbi:hypothetical protein STENM327S_00594 [Streptomyces tendae]
MLAQTLRVLVEDAQGLAEGRADDAAAGHVRAHRVRPGHRGAADGPVRPDHPAPVGGRHALAGPGGGPLSVVSGTMSDGAQVPSTRTKRTCRTRRGRTTGGGPAWVTTDDGASGTAERRHRLALRQRLVGAARAGARRTSPHHWSRCTAPTRRRCIWPWARGWRARRDWYLAPELRPTLFDRPGRGGPLAVAGTDGPLPRSDGRPHPQIRGGGSLITDGGICLLPPTHELCPGQAGGAERPRVCQAVLGVTDDVEAVVDRVA